MGIVLAHYRKQYGFSQQEVRIMIAKKEAEERIYELSKKGISITMDDFTKGNSIRLYNSIEIELLLILFHYNNSLKNDVLEQELFEVLEFITKYSQNAIDLINQGAGFYYLANIYFLRGRTMGKLFLETKKAWQREKALEECRTAFHLFQIEGNKEQENKVIKFYYKICVLSVYRDSWCIYKTRILRKN